MIHASTRSFACSKEGFLAPVLSGAATAALCRRDRLTEQRPLFCCEPDATPSHIATRIHNVNVMNKTHNSHKAHAQKTHTRDTTTRTYNTCNTCTRMQHMHTHATHAHATPHNTPQHHTAPRSTTHHTATLHTTLHTPQMMSQRFTMPTSPKTAPTSHRTAHVSWKPQVAIRNRCGSHV